MTSTEGEHLDILQKLFGLDGRVAVVTGGASGLGTAFSKGLAASAPVDTERRHPASAASRSMVRGGSARSGG